MNQKFYAYMLALADKTQLQWSGKDDGSAWGKPSRYPTHVYTVTLNADGEPVLQKRELQAGEKFGQQDLKRLRLYHDPESYHYKGIAIGLGSGFVLTLTSILLTLLFAQMMIDKEKQQDIENEAKRAIAICTATEAISRSDFDKAERILDEADHLFSGEHNTLMPEALQHKPNANGDQAQQQAQGETQNAPKSKPTSDTHTSSIAPAESSASSNNKPTPPITPPSADNDSEWMPDAQPNQQFQPAETGTQLGGEPWMPPTAPQKTPQPVADLPDIRMKSDDDKPTIKWQSPAKRDNRNKVQPSAPATNTVQNNGEGWQPPTNMATMSQPQSNTGNNSEGPQDGEGWQPQ